MLVRRSPGREGAPTGFRSVSPSMLLSWIPVPGTKTPEPQPVEEESEAALPRPSRTLTCVVDGRPRGSLAAERPSRASMRPTASATRSSESSLRARPPRWSAATNAPSRAAAASRAISASVESAAGLPGRPADAHAVEQPQRVGDQDSARRRRRVRHHLVASIGDAHRTSLDDPVGGEVLLRDPPAASADCGDQPPGQLPVVESVRAAGGDPLERGRERAHDEAFAGAQGPSSAVHLLPLGLATQHVVEHGVEERLLAGQLDAVARQLDRRREQPRPGQRAEAPVGCGQARDRTRDGARCGADQKGLRRVAGTERNSDGVGIAADACREPAPGTATKKSRTKSRPSRAR